MNKKIPLLAGIAVCILCVVAGIFILALPAGEPGTSSTIPPVTIPDETTSPETSEDPTVIAARPYMQFDSMKAESIPGLFEGDLADVYTAQFLYTKNVISAQCITQDGKAASNVSVQLIGHREGKENLIVLHESITDNDGNALLFFDTGFVPTEVKSGDITVAYNTNQNTYKLTVVDNFELVNTAILFELYETEETAKYQQLLYPALNRFLDTYKCPGYACAYNFYNDYKATSHAINHVMYTEQLADNNFVAQYDEHVLDTKYHIGKANTLWGLNTISLVHAEYANNVAFFFVGGDTYQEVTGEMDKTFVYAVRELAKSGVRIVPIILPDASKASEVRALTMAAMTNSPYIRISETEELANLDKALADVMQLLKY